MEVKAEYLAIFSEEASDQLREWEECLLALEKSPGDGEQLNRMFRAIHTLKGSAGFIGFDGLQKVAHDLESSLQKCATAAAPSTPPSSLLFEGLDLCRSMIDAFTDGREASVDAADFLARLAAVQAVGPSAAETPAPGGEGGADSPVSRSDTSVPAGGPLTTCRLSIRIEGQPREAYLRSFIVKDRLERLGRILAVEPCPESLGDSSGPFVYGVTLETAAMHANHSRFRQRGPG